MIRAEWLYRLADIIDIPVSEYILFTGNVESKNKNKCNAEL